MKLKVVLVLTALAVGRAMTIPFIARAGGNGAGDPPKAWLMPLLGDAVVGIAALAVVWLLLSRPTPGAWTAAVIFHSIAAFDAVTAYVVDVSAP